MAVSSREKRKLTYEEWLTFPTEEGTRDELIDGKVWVTPLPSPRHQKIVGNLIFVFQRYLREHGGGEVYLPVNVRLSDDQGFGPDLIFVREWGDDPMTYHGPPPLVVEVVSDPRRDQIKRARYEQYGVPEYWALLPEAEQVQIFLAVGRHYGPPTVHEAPEPISPLALPDLRIDLSEIFTS